MRASNQDILQARKLAEAKLASGIRWGVLFDILLYFTACEFWQVQAEAPPVDWIWRTGLVLATLGAFLKFLVRWAEHFEAVRKYNELNEIRHEQDRSSTISKDD